MEAQQRDIALDLTELPRGIRERRLADGQGGGDVPGGRA